MKYAKLENSGIEVSKLCVGCMSFGKPSADFHEWTLSPAETEEVVKAALDNGINFFDTANVYSHGTSEEYLGRAIRNTTTRDKVVIASKVYFNEGHLPKEAINREIEGTLKRLGTDYLDLYIIHRFDYSTPIIGATKPKYFTDAAGALDVELSDEDAAYLEELYVPHRVVGALPEKK